jgi:hypothetical protein
MHATNERCLLYAAMQQGTHKDGGCLPAGCLLLQHAPQSRCMPGNQSLVLRMQVLRGAGQPSSRQQAAAPAPARMAHLK